MENVLIKKIKIVLNYEHPFKLIIVEFLRKIGISMPFLIDRGRYKIKYYSSTYSRGLYVIPHDRQYDEGFFIRYIKNGDIIVDIGANIGELTLLSASLSKENGKVYAFEANLKTYNKYLLKNIKLNDFHNIVPFCMALGDQNSVAELADLKSDGCNYIVESKSNNIRTVKTKLSRLEDLIPSTIQRINLLKIDTEGYELFVLKGAGNVLDKTDCIYYESYEGQYNRFAYQTKDVLSFLTRKSYKVFRIIKEEHICEIKDTSHYQSSQLENLIAVKDVGAFIKRTAYKIEI